MLDFVVSTALCAALVDVTMAVSSSPLMVSLLSRKPAALCRLSALALSNGRRPVILAIDNTAYFEIDFSGDIVDVVGRAKTLAVLQE